jgi:large subunit ribosomal protein LP0
MVLERKSKIVTKLCEAFHNYKQIIVVKLDNVSTNQIHRARNILCSNGKKGEMIVGKNTLIKKALKFCTETPNPASPDYEDHKKWTQNADLLSLEPLMKGNVALLFCDSPYPELREQIEAEKIKMPARTGVVAPVDVWIKAGPTGIEVGKIDLFHKLNISCKTVKSAIEVVKDVKIITKGTNVGEGATRMCKLLNIVPFEYSLMFKYVYLSGTILDETVIEMPQSDITDAMKLYAGYLTGLSLGADIPNSLSVPHFVSNGFKSLLAMGEETGYEFKQLTDAKANSSNCTAQATTVTASKVVEAVAAPEEEEEEEDMDLGDLFG